MQNVVIDKPYQFIPPYPGTFWLRFLRYWVPYHVHKHLGVEQIEWRYLDRLRASLQAGHGVLLTPNHCRPCDPPVVGLIGKETECPTFVLASWHLFMQSRFQGWLMRRAGAFSIYREGLDREALRAASAVLVDGRRPLVVFPEGIVSRTNDRLGVLQDGTAFIARTAARLRARLNPPGKVVVHPLALKYFFLGDLQRAVDPVLCEIEKRLSWQTRSHRPLRERICAVGEGLLALKEIEYLGKAQAGSHADRLHHLLEAVLQPLEKEWLNGPQGDQGVIERIKRLRIAIVPDMAANKVTPEERARRWRHLADVYLAQQLNSYPPDYLDGLPSTERVLETVERFEEDLTDEARVHRPLRVIIQVGEAIEVSPEKVRGASEDPLMVQIREQLATMIAAVTPPVTNSPFASA